MNHGIKSSLVSCLVMSSFMATAYAVRTEGICLDIAYPLNECAAISLCPDICNLHSQVWTGNFGTSTDLCEDQHKEGNSIYVCVKE